MGDEGYGGDTGEDEVGATTGSILIFGSSWGDGSSETDESNGEGELPSRRMSPKEDGLGGLEGIGGGEGIGGEDG